MTQARRYWFRKMGKFASDQLVRAYGDEDKGLPLVKVFYDPAADLWELIDTVVVSVKAPSGAITVPAGYRFDLASVPRYVWPIVAPFELGSLAPLCHDWIYDRDGQLPEGKFSRKQADRIFLDLMKREGISWWRRAAAYNAVRWFARRW